MIDIPFGWSLETLTVVLTWTVIPTIVIGACLSDFRNNVCKHPKQFQRRRFANWFTMGLTYALSYFGRYSINVLNVESVYKTYGTTKEGYGNIIAAAFWVYAIFIIVNGFVTDKLGPRMGMLVGSFGCAISNLAAGAYLQYCPWRGNKWVFGMAIIICVMNYFQTFSACSIVKLGAYWYNPRERGFFGSVFGVLIAFGFFLAYQVNGLLMKQIPYQWLFYNPGIALSVMFVLNYLIVKSKPTDLYSIDNPLIRNLYTKEFKPVTDKSEDARSFGQMVAPVLRQGVFYVFFAAEFFLGWFRDGILTHFAGYFDSLGIDSGSAVYTLSSTGITVGSMFGSLFAGIVSDLFFKSRRQPVAFLCCVMVTILLTVLYFFVDSIVIGPSVLGLTAIFYQGIHGILTATCAMDFAGSGSAGIAVGLLDASQKVASSLTGNVMPLIMKVDVDDEGDPVYSWPRWVLSMIPASVCCGILFLFIMGLKATHGKVGKKSDDENSAPLLVHEEETIQDKV
ncbi:hypothetical protein P9112_011336 [Eukaryota sp. TZLM1-RC]